MKWQPSAQFTQSNTCLGPASPSETSLRGHHEVNSLQKFKTLPGSVSAQSSFFNFISPFQQMLARFLKRGCGFGTTSRPLRSVPKTRAVGLRTLWTSSTRARTWPRNRSTSASAPPGRPASSSTSALSPRTSWQFSSNPPVRTRTASLPPSPSGQTECSRRCLDYSVLFFIPHGTLRKSPNFFEPHSLYESQETPHWLSAL